MNNLAVILILSLVLVLMDDQGVDAMAEEKREQCSNRAMCIDNCILLHDQEEEERIHVQATTTVTTTTATTTTTKTTTTMATTTTTTTPTTTTTTTTTARPSTVDAIMGEEGTGTLGSDYMSEDQRWTARRRSSYLCNVNFKTRKCIFTASSCSEQKIRYACGEKCHIVLKQYERECPNGKCRATIHCQ